MLLVNYEVFNKGIEISEAWRSEILGGRIQTREVAKQKRTGTCSLIVTEERREACAFKILSVNQQFFDQADFQHAKTKLRLPRSIMQ